MMHYLKIGMIALLLVVVGCARPYQPAPMLDVGNFASVWKGKPSEYLVRNLNFPMKHAVVIGNLQVLEWEKRETLCRAYDPWTYTYSECRVAHCHIRVSIDMESDTIHDVAYSYELPYTPPSKSGLLKQRSDTKMTDYCNDYWGLLIPDAGN